MGLKHFVQFGVVLTLLILGSGVPVQGQSGEETLEHPVIAPFPNSVLRLKSSKRENYSVNSFRIEVDNRPQSVEKGGVSWVLDYSIVNANGEPDKTVSNAEVLRNYQLAVEERGGTVHRLGSNYTVFSIPREDGGTTWAKINCSPARYRIEIIDEEPMVRKLTFGADELKVALDSEGRIAIYGINFELGKADLQLGAEALITEIVKLLKNFPELKVEVQGHTDNTGSADLNMKLSQQRAETVQQFISLYGVDASRTPAKGYGMTKPIASNDTEEGRAENRRVELVKLN